MEPVGMDSEQQRVVEIEALGVRFETAEARYAYEKARRLRLVIRYAGGLLLLLAFGYAMFLLGGGGGTEREACEGETQSGEHKHDGKKPGSIDIDPVGSASAAVQVNAILPEGSDCHDTVVKFLTEIGKAYPRKLRAEFSGMESLSEEELSDKVGEVCAAILVNGKTKFKFRTPDGKEVAISLVGTVPTHYSLGDLGYVINQAFSQEYGTDTPAPVDLTKYKLSGTPPTDTHDDRKGAPREEEEETSDPEPDFELPGFREVKDKP